jgi:hypothetical protein
MDSVFMQRAMSGSLPVKVVGGTPIEPHIPRPAVLEPIHITVEPTFSLRDFVDPKHEWTLEPEAVFA